MEATGVVGHRPMIEVKMTKGGRSGESCRIRKQAGYQIQEIDQPVLGDYDVRVRNKAVGICGTDIHIFNGEKVPRRLVFPR